VSEIQTYYQGRKWDAPMTDDAIERDLSGHTCVMCQESITADDNAIMNTQPWHLECSIRSGLGDVQHLERRCLCFRGTGNEITHESDHHETYRESAKAALQWVLDHNQGRFHP
jgi:hypothetical protein